MGADPPGAITFAIQFVVVKGVESPNAVAAFTLTSAVGYAAATQFFLRPRLIVDTAVMLFVGSASFFAYVGQWFLSGYAFTYRGLIAVLGIFAQSRTRALLQRATEEAVARVHAAEAANREVRGLNDELRRPGALTALVDRCLRDTPTERPTAQALVAALRLQISQSAR